MDHLDKEAAEGGTWEGPLGLSAEDRQQLHRLVAAFPRVRFAAGYGSGVVPQADAAAQQRKPMKDFIFAVDEARQWHADNLMVNRDHYSGVGWLGSGAVAWLQEEVGAGIYYNTHINVMDEVIKYGVITTKDLISDLKDWDTLYVSGRMQKPFVVVQADEEVSLANQANLESALSASLLLLPSRVTERQLWETLAGLSYTGDFRMKFGENPNKIKNIVTDKNAEAFRLMYRPTCAKVQHLLSVEDDGGFAQDTGRAARHDLLLRLPARLKADIEHQTGGSLVEISGYPPESLASVVTSAIASIVRSSSRTQSLKGVLTAGLVKTVAYTASKVGKMRKAGAH